MSFTDRYELTFTRGMFIMRALLGLVLIVVLALAALVYTGFINLNTHGGSLPQVRATAGSLPSVDVKTGSIETGTRNTTVDVPTMGTKKETVAVPTIGIKKADNAN